jgi:hypothetical protein
LIEQFQEDQMRNLVFAMGVGLFVLTALGFTTVKVGGIEVKTERKSVIETNEEGYITRMLWQPNEHLGVFETKQSDKNGKVTQWTQQFVDEEGKVLITIVRDPLGQGATFAYEDIRVIQYNKYRPDRNISEFYEYTGDGVLRQRVKYIYDQNGEWVEGIIYNSKGQTIGKEMTPPEARLYGSRKEHQHK